MADKDLNVNIKIAADTAGAKATQQALEAVGKTAEETGKKAEKAFKAIAIPQTPEGIQAAKAAQELQKQKIADAKKEVDAIEKTSTAQRQEIVTTNSAKEAKEKLTKANNNAAMGFMALSNAVQDAQYGFGGLVNNIPMIAAGLGLGTGVAAAAQLAAVGVQFLTKNLDIFGTEAAAVRKEAEEEAMALRRAANEAEYAAEKTERLNSANRSLTNEIKNIAAAYDEATAAADRALKKQQAKLDAEMAQGDAIAQRDLALIDLEEQKGTISEKEANQRRAGVRMQTMARRDKIELEKLAAEEKRFRNEAAAAEKAANQSRQVLNTRLSNQNAAGLLSNEERKSAEENAKFARQNAEAQQKIIEEQTGIIVRAKANLANPAIAINPQTAKIFSDKIATAQEKLATARVRQSEAAVYAAEAENKIQQDRAAQQRTGFTSKAEFEAAKKAEQAEVHKFALKQQTATEEAKAIADRKPLIEERARINSETAAVQATAIYVKDEKKEREEADKERKRREKEQEKDGKKSALDRGRERIASEGVDVVDAFAGSKIFSTGTLEALQKTAEGVKGGGAEEIGQLIAMMRTIVKFQGKFNERQKSEIEELKAAINDYAQAK